MPLVESLTPEQVDAFDRDGFVIVEEGLVPDAALDLPARALPPLFDGDYETGIKPDEVNWVPGRDPEDRTRQICNGWRADTVVAAQVLSERTGRLAAQLARYRGIRLLQDNVLWKPPGTKAIGFHQDASYADYLVPAEMITCWISLDEPDRGCRARSSTCAGRTSGRAHRRSARSSTRRRTGSRRRAAPRPNGEELDVVPVVVKAGGGSFHHGLTWHGSPPNTNAATARMALVSHMLPVEVRFHETNVDLIYSRYSGAATSRSTSRSSPCCGTRPAIARRGSPSCLPSGRRGRVPPGPRVEVTCGRAAWKAAPTRTSFIPSSGAEVPRRPASPTRSRETGSRARRAAHAAVGGASSAARSSSCATAMPVRSLGDDVARRPWPGSRISISPISSPAPERTVRPGRSTRTVPSVSSVERHARLASLHQELAVRERPLDAGREQLVEQLARELREERGSRDDPLVAAAVEEQRRSLAVADVLDLAEEERVVAAPVGAHDARDEMRERAFDERRVANDLEQRLRRVLGDAAREPVGQRRLALLEHADAVARALAQQPVHPRAPVDRDQHERRPQRDRHERVGGHAVHLLADARGDHRDAGREHPERAPELDRRVASPRPEPLSISSGSGTSSNGESSSPSGGPVIATPRHGDVELLRQLHAEILTVRAGAPAGAGAPGPTRSLPSGDGSAGRRVRPPRPPASSACPHASAAVSPSCTMRRKRKSSSDAPSTATPMIFTFVPLP